MISRAVDALGRLILVGAMLIMGLGRMGLFSTSNTITALPAMLYGGMLTAGGLAMLLTAGRLRSAVVGRVVAGFGACVLAGFATDLLAAGGSITSVGMLFWFAVAAACEGLANHA